MARTMSQEFGFADDADFMDSLEHTLSNRGRLYGNGMIRIANQIFVDISNPREGRELEAFLRQRRPPSQPLNAWAMSASEIIAWLASRNIIAPARIVKSPRVVMEGGRAARVIESGGRVHELNTLTPSQDDAILRRLNRNTSLEALGIQDEEEESEEEEEEEE